MKNGGDTSGDGPLANKLKDRKSNTRQKNIRGDRKGESNDSPKIPDRRDTSVIPSLSLRPLKLEFLFLKSQMLNL